ncbi:unnamed protein product [Litomosoides sigmodontis]|uniref:MYND-type domain-containing protein n=1 Tax=Litomosoides sigmodontis TaxID=42156 RepID=A0A3P6T7K4_LITSI|nr:unnamed protein product [Litomosoides sigmodontis]
MDDEGVPSTGFTSIKQLPGYTVTTVPSDWNVPDDRHTRVVEVSDTLIGSNRASSSRNTYLQRLHGRMTVEEVLDSIFQRTKPSSTSLSSRHEMSFPEGELVDYGQMQKSGIYVKSNTLMQRLVEHPNEAEALLQNERLYVRCACCHQTRELAEARMQYISCKHCYVYYCSRQCREHDWSKHREACSFSRINTLCKEVIIKVSNDYLLCNDKFILSVSIIADIEHCPQTPPPEPVVIQPALPLSQYAQQSPLLSHQQPVEQENVHFIHSEEFRSAVPTEV